MLHMRRREFITLLGGAAAWPLAARAQQTAKLPTIGFMGASTPSAWSRWVAAFEQQLRTRGWMDGRTVAIEYRWAQGRPERLTEIALEFVRLKVDVIFAPVTAAALAARKETSTIPIVFALVGDPVGIGLIASLARPGGNVTGFSNQSTDLGSKRLDILREVVPRLRRLAILVNVGNPSNVREIAGVRAAAQTLGLEVVVLEVRKAADIESGFEALAGRIDALYVAADALLFTNLNRIIDFMYRARLPTMHGSQEYVEAGGLISYGQNNLDQFRHAAEYVHQILKGSKPADLPVAQPTSFNLVINLKTAQAIGLTMPPLLLARADEVIE
jgi:putative tryptophan/tyrosine transport system substrate-binding protein